MLIIWNNRQIDTSPFVSDYEDLLRSLGKPYEDVAHRNEETITRKLNDFFIAGSLKIAEYDNPHTLNWPGLCGRFFSASYAPAKNDPLYDGYVVFLKQIFQKYSVDNQVTFDQKTRVYYGKIAEENILQITP